MILSSKVVNDRRLCDLGLSNNVLRSLVGKFLQGSRIVNRDSFIAVDVILERRM